MANQLDSKDRLVAVRLAVNFELVLMVDRWFLLIAFGPDRLEAEYTKMIRR